MKSNKSAYKNVIYSMTGSIFNIIIPIIVFPYVTRVLGVVGIGKYSFYSSALTYAALFTGFGIALYGSREIGKFVDNRQKRAQSFAELITINLITVAISAILIVYFAFFSSYSDDWLIIILFSLTLLTNAIGAEWFFVGIEMQGFMLVRNVIFKTLSTIMIFLLVTEPEHLARYVAITIFSLAGTSLTNIYYWIKLSDFRSLKALRLSKYLKPLSSIFSIEILLRYLGLGDVVILGVLAGDNAVGIYSMGLKVFLLVSSVLKVTATTLMPRSAYYLETNDRDGFNRLLNKTIRMLFLVGMPVSACLYLFAEPIILILGGSQFEGSVGLMKKMSFFLLLSVLVNTYVFQALYPQNKTKSIICAHLVGLVFGVLLNCILVPYLSYHGTFIAFAVSNLVIAGVLVGMESTFFKGSFLLRDYLNYIIATAISVVLAYLCSMLLSGSFWVISAIIFGLIYMVSLQLLKDDLYLNIKQSIIRKIK